MSERDFQLSAQVGCILYSAQVVVVQGEDARLRYWIECLGMLKPGPGDWPATPAGEARLKAAADEQFWRLVCPPLWSPPA